MDSNVERICERHRGRAAHGLIKYGVTTERTDLCTLQWVQHYQDEVMDGSVYAERLKVELHDIVNSLDVIKKDLIECDGNMGIVIDRCDTIQKIIERIVGAK